MFDCSDLIGMEYIPGRQDCFSIGRRFFSKHFDLQIKNYARPDRFWEDPALDLYQLYRREGFRLVHDDQIEIGDVLLCSLNTSMATHACIVIADNEVLHHPPGGLSTIERMRPRWTNRMTNVIRHPKVTAALSPRVEIIHLHEVVSADLFRNPDFEKTVARVLGSGN